MSVTLYQNGKAENFDPFLFKQQLNHGWFLTREESLNGVRKEENKEITTEKVRNEEDIPSQEGDEAEEVIEILAPGPRPRTTFNCKGCGKRRNRFRDTIIYDEAGKKFCSEECKTLND